MKSKAKASGSARRGSPLQRQQIEDGKAGGRQKLLWAGLPVLLLALAGPFFSLPAFGRGFWFGAEPVVIAGFGLAGLAALWLAFRLALGHSPSRPAMQQALAALAVAAWLLLSGPGGFTLQDWRLRLMGMPDTGYGALWFAVLAIWLLLADALRRDAAAWRLIFWGAMLCSAGMAALLIYNLLAGTFYGFRVQAFYGWAGLMLPVIALSLPPSPGQTKRAKKPALGFLARHAELLLALALGLLLLALSRAITLLAAGLGGLCIAWLWHWLPREGAFGRLRRRPAVGLLLAAAALAPLAALSVPQIAELAPSLESRRLLWSMVWALLEQKPLIWLIGNGVGTSADTAVTQLAAAGFPLWNFDGWDALRADHNHTHNWIMQALHDGGLPAVLLIAWMIMRPVWLAQPARRGAALGLTMAYLLALGLWMEFLPVMAYLALAWIALLPPAEKQTDKPIKPAPLVAAAALAALGCLSLWSSYRLEIFARQFDQQVAWLFDASETNLPVPEDYRSGPLPPPPPYPDDPRRHELQSAEMLLDAGKWAVRRHDGSRPGPVDPERDAQRMRWLIQIIREHIDQAPTPRFAAHAVRLISDVMQRNELASLQPLLIAELPLWRRAVQRGLALAPGRADFAMGYLDWTFKNGRRDLTLDLAREMRRRDPENPVALFYEGAVLASEDNAAGKQQGIALLRRAIGAGLQQFFPVDDAFKRSIGAL